MQMGGFSLAIARMAAGTDQRPSPAMKPDAATGTNWSASAGFRLSQISFTSDPMHMSTYTKLHNVLTHCPSGITSNHLIKRAACQSMCFQCAHAHWRSASSNVQQCNTFACSSEMRWQCAMST